MDTISSAEFRKTYAKLTQATVVTVNGHAIGVWLPDGPLADRAATLAAFPVDPRIERPFSSRPFTPAPKPGRG